MRLYWNVRGVNIRGVRVVVRRGDDVLLIRHAYGSRDWGLPGGGIKRTEDPLEAAVRETREEVNVRLRSIAGVAANPIQTRGRGPLWVFVAEPVSESFTVDRVEIDSAAWHPISALPDDLLGQTRVALAAAGIIDDVQLQNPTENLI